MSQINIKSISGITSITTPAGVDNRFSLYNYDSSERFVLDHSGNLNISGVTTATNFKTGTTNVHNVGVEAAGINVLGADTPIGAGATIFNSGDVVSKAGAEFQGIVTATSFSGSGSNLTGLASREVYGFTGIGKSLSLTTTNNGADNITNATYVAFEETFIGPSGISFSINTSGNLIMTV